MRLPNLWRAASLRVYAQRAQTLGQTNILVLEGRPASGPPSIDGEPLQTLGFTVFGGAEADGECITTLGLYGAAVVTAVQELTTLGIVAEDGSEAGGAYLTTMGVAE